MVQVLEVVNRTSSNIKSTSNMRKLRQLAIILFTFSLIPSVETIYSQPVKTTIYGSPSYTIEQRIDDLVSRMTLEEKVGQMKG